MINKVLAIVLTVLMILSGLVPIINVNANIDDNGTFIAEDLAVPESVFELSGFKAALKSFDINISSSNILVTRQNRLIQRDRIKKFFDGSGYSACFIRNANTALQIAPILKKQMNIPQEMSMICSGNKGQQALLSKHGITLIDSRLDKMCESGLKTLTDMIDGIQPKRILSLLEPKLIVKDNVRVKRQGLF